jgi:hypothetical protein
MTFLPWGGNRLATGQKVGIPLGRSGIPAIDPPWSRSVYFFVSFQDPEAANRLGDELGRLVFGG